MSDNNFIDIDNIRNNITIYIYTTPYVINIAEYISNIFQKYNIKNFVIVSLISDQHFDLINQDNNSFILYSIYMVWSYCVYWDSVRIGHLFRERDKRVCSI